MRYIIAVDSIKRHTNNGAINQYSDAAATPNMLH